MVMIRVLLLACGLAAGTHPLFEAGAGSPSHPRDLASLGPRAAPESWARQVLPANGGVLFLPRRFRAVGADVGASSWAVGTGPAYRFYVNVTPNSSPLAGFPAARLDHQRAEELEVHALGSAPTVRFHGGHGACVADRYVTAVGGHHYEEISCLVKGRHSSVELVTAAAVTHWGEEIDTFRRVIEALTVR